MEGNFQKIPMKTKSRQPIRTCLFWPKHSSVMHADRETPNRSPAKWGCFEKEKQVCGRTTHI